MEIVEESERKPVTVGDRNRRHPGDAGMRELEPVPFPRCRRHSEKMANHDRVGPSMGDQYDPALCVGAELPEPEVRFEFDHAFFGHCGGQPGDDSLVKVNEAFPARHSFPDLGDRSQVAVDPCGVDVAERFLFPIIGIAYLMRPVLDLGLNSQGLSDRYRRLPRSLHRRHPEFVDGSPVGSAGGEKLGLAMTELRKVRIIPIEGVGGEVRQTMPNQNQFHVDTEIPDARFQTRL